MNKLVEVAIVEDEEAIHELFQIYFKTEVRQKKYKLHHFLNGEECFNYLEEHSAEIKILLILSDINMPIMDGFDLLELTQKHFPKIQTIMISAYEKEEYIAKAQNLGAKKYLTKPLDFEKLKIEMDRLLSHAA
ncbi:response regulator [Candidatus Kaiserbacteria bacterium]|nr:MAG: response regulator [Candidatus Kaiserbacteria bacterium]